MSEPILQLDRVSKAFVVRRSASQARAVLAVDNVSLQVRPGETVGIVGESGSGKTTLARLALYLMKPSSGRVLFDGHSLGDLSARTLRQIRRRIQPIFQDPYSSLNPRQKVRSIVRAPLDVHDVGRPASRAETVVEVLERLGLGAHYLDRSPHQLSGGERQRVAIARALVLRPALIVADEPTSALDVSVQAQILKLLIAIRDDFALSYLFISHNLAVVKYLCDWVAVIYLGRIVEFGRRDQIFNDPQHPYTQALLASVPIVDPRLRRERQRLSDDLPSLSDMPAGCRFHTRCVYAFDRCRQEDPPDYQPAAGHRVACYLRDPSSARAAGTQAL